MSLLIPAAPVGGLHGHRLPGLFADSRRCLPLAGSVAGDGGLGHRQCPQGQHGPAWPDGGERVGSLALYHRDQSTVLHSGQVVLEAIGSRIEQRAIAPSPGQRSSGPSPDHAVLVAVRTATVR